MWIRFKRWNYLTPLAPHVAMCAAGRRYLWDGKHEGVTDVPYKADVEELLNPLGDQQSSYEVAFEKYGVTFDAQGKELVVEAPPLLIPDTAHSPRPVGRPRK